LTQAQPIFVFGRLRDVALRDAVLGAGLRAEAAALPDHARCAAADPADGAHLRAAPGAALAGELLHPDAAAQARLELYLGLRGARAIRVDARGPTGPVSARAYLCGAGGTGAGWDFADWQARHAGAEALAWAEIAALSRAHPPATLRLRYPMALAHAASHLRARTEAAPAALRGDWSGEAIRPLSETRPYAGYFAVAEDALQFRRFDGSWSREVRRAALVMADAVTVLPYDPGRDCVLVVEQFRYGPWVRGARNAWSLEPIAGRIDPGERPAESAAREAFEEARLDLSPEALLSVANCYPSPAAVTEFLYQFVALCELPDGVTGVAGVEGEAEDIRSHVLPFARLMELIASGEVVNGPLVLTAYWLAQHRPELRARRAGPMRGV